MKLLKKAGLYAEEASVLLSKLHNEKLKVNESRVIRDKAYSYMTEAMTKIRQAGQYIFWKNPERKQGCVSKYNKSKKKANSKA